MAKITPKELREKIAARKAEREASKTQKYAKMRAVAAKAPDKLEKHLIGLADKFASMAEGIENLRENLGLTRAAKNAPLKTRIAAAKNYGRAFRRIAEEAPEKMEEALREAYNGLNDIAADIEMAAEQMGVSLEEAPEGSFDEAGEYHDEFNSVPPAVVEEAEEEGESVEHEMEEKEDDEKEASGSDNFVMNDKVHGINAPIPEAKAIEASRKSATDWLSMTEEEADAEWKKERPGQRCPKCNKPYCTNVSGKPGVGPLCTCNKSAAKKEAMSRKDFILIADAIREFPMPHDQRRQLAEHFAKYLRGTNYNFMSGRFVDYCLGEGGARGGEYKGEAPANKDILFEGVPTQEESMTTKSKRPLGL